MSVLLLDNKELRIIRAALSLAFPGERNRKIEALKSYNINEKLQREGKL